jgi:hypothetical protein
LQAVIPAVTIPQLWGCGYRGLIKRRQTLRLFDSYYSALAT